MASKYLLLVALLAVSAVATDDVTARGEKLLAAVQQTTCGTAGVDLSSLTLASGGTAKDYQYATSDKHYTWYLNVCADTIAPCLGDSKTAPGVWNYNYQQPYACFNLGDKTQATWAAPPGATYAASVKYAGGDSCYNTQPASQYTVEMRFQCDATAAAAVLDNVVAGATQCDYIATFRTAVACGGSSAGGKGAWVFNIIVLAGLPTYFAAGFLYNWKVKNLEGSERIPHMSFWSDLPSLVKDGCLFFVYLLKVLAFKIGALSLPPEAPVPSSGYSTASSGSSYSATPDSAPTSMGMGAGNGAYGTI